MKLSEGVRISVQLSAMEFFCPTPRIETRERDGARNRNQYYQTATPYQPSRTARACQAIPNQNAASSMTPWVRLSWGGRLMPNFDAYMYGQSYLSDGAMFLISEFFCYEATRS
jgi:hypothetical protein